MCKERNHLNAHINPKKNSRDTEMTIKEAVRRFGGPLESYYMPPVHADIPHSTVPVPPELITERSLLG